VEAIGILLSGYFRGRAESFGNSFVMSPYGTKRTSGTKQTSRASATILASDPSGRAAGREKCSLADLIQKKAPARSPAIFENWLEVSKSDGHQTNGIRRYLTFR
jgi:hypothetical protein